MSAERQDRPHGQGAGTTAWSRLTEAARVLVGVTVGCTVLAAMAQAGTIQGTVRYTGPDVEGKKLAVTSNQYVCGKEKDSQDLELSADRGIRNAVVSLQSPPPGARWNAYAPPPQIDQLECVFIPRVAVVPVGGTLEFLNSDRLLHNIRSKDIRLNRKFNRTQPRGRTIPITFEKKEIVGVGCDLHPWMRAWVVVAEHPFYAITGNQGDFTLDNVPAGRHTLQVWQETLGTVNVEVTVQDEGATAVTIEMAPQ